MHKCLGVLMARANTGTTGGLIVDRFYDRHIRCYDKHGNELVYIFVSKRLVKLIKKKVKSADWIFLYFSIKNNFCFYPGTPYFAKLISTNGVILFVKEG